MAAGASTRKKALDIRQERKDLVSKARKILDTASAEKRAMRADEESQYEQMMSDVDSMKKRIDALERMADTEDEVEREEDPAEEEEDIKDESADDEEDEDPEETQDEESGDRKNLKPVLINGKRYWVYKNPNKRGGINRVTRERYAGEDEVAYRNRMRRGSKEYRQAFSRWLVDGALNTPLAKRAIQADSDIVGGYLVAPQEFVGQLIKFVDNLLFIRQEATKYTVASAQSLGAPSLDQDISDADWTSELDTGNEDNSMQFGKRELTPHPLAKRIKVSNRLLRMATVTGGASADGSAPTGGPEGMVRARLGYKFAVTEEKAFMVGNGVQQPLGVFTASSRGISTNRDVLTGNSNGITADALIAAKYNQKIQYWKRLKWIYNRTVLQLIRQLKDANGQYLWVPGGFGGESDTLLDLPVMMSEYAPNTVSTGNYIGILGDFSFYWIADSETMQIQRLVELYAAANQVGFIARMELDGMPVLEEAFTRLKCN